MKPRKTTPAARAKMTSNLSPLKKVRLVKPSHRARLAGDPAAEQQENIQYLIYLLRCFGDGIAFLYLDKWTLKHMMYETGSYRVKSPPGSLSGKAGLKRETQIVRRLRSENLPAILCDITNVLRHGDICILVGPDPVLIEVKSGSNSNKRIARQIQSLKELSSFYETDEAQDFRGLPHVKRSAFKSLEVTHVAAINRCIEDSEGKDMAAACPETGLAYACVRNANGVDRALPADPSCQAFYILNEPKTKRSWQPYYPFTLSIRRP